MTSRDPQRQRTGPRRPLRTGTAAGLLVAGVWLAACAAPLDVRPRGPGPSPSAGGWRLSVQTACEIVPDRARPSSDPARVGGLSGIVFDGRSGTWLAVSDDQQVPRWYRLRLDAGQGPCRVNVVGTVRVADPGPGTGLARDVEGIAILPNGNVLLSTERVEPASPRQPGLFEYTGAGEFVRTFAVRGRFVPRSDRPAYGTRDNASFESATVAPGGQRAFTATEQPLLQDDQAPSFGRGGLARLLEYVVSPGAALPAREFALPLEPLPHPGDLKPISANTGVVDLVALDERTVVMLERSFVRGRRGQATASFNDIVLSRLDLEDADDVSEVESLARALVRPVRKTVLLRLTDIADQLPEWLSQLENFEGIATGPTLADGARSLVLVSDDNFSASQRTAFVVLRLSVE